MTDFAEYPQMLYKGEAHRVVDDAEAHEAAKGEGWLTWAEAFAPEAQPVDPLDHDANGKKGGSRKRAPAEPEAPQE